MRDPRPIVIYDGECRFCRACLAWLRLDLEVVGIPFQEANLKDFGLSLSECEKSVYVVTMETKLSGAHAVEFLLRLRGKNQMARAIRYSGPLGHLLYKWVASHRNSWLIQVLTKYFEGATLKAEK